MSSKDAAKRAKPKHGAEARQPRKTAVITGVTSQDGSYLAELLLDKGYEVIGVVRRTSHDSYERIGHLLDRVHVVAADLLDQHSLTSVIRDARPQEVYNLAAQSFVPTSWTQPVLTGEFTALGVTRLLEAVRLAGPEARVYQASSSEMFGKAAETPQRETTPFYPRSPYGVAKLYGHWITVNYREAYGLFACSGILFNHESPIRGETFVSRKITRGLARIHEEIDECLYLGNLGARRDWGHARDYVRAQWLMLQQPLPDDFVIASGEQHSVRDFVVRAGERLKMRIEWRGEGLDEQGIDGRTGKVVVRVDARYFRPAEVDALLGDASKARSVLGWKPEIGFDALVTEMVEQDLAIAQRDALVKREGFKTFKHLE